jgi:hypothetical protein
LKILLWTFPADCRERTSRIAGTSECRIGFVECLPGNREPIGQGLPHADLLRSLSWKDECDHEIT